MTTLLTEKEVIEEFFMNSNTIQNGIDNGSLNVIRKSKHGVPFICFDRAEIENMASTVMPDLVLKTKIEKENLLASISDAKDQIVRLELILKSNNDLKKKLIEEKQDLTEYIEKNKAKKKKVAVVSKESKVSVAAKKNSSTMRMDTTNDSEVALNDSEIVFNDSNIMIPTNTSTRSNRIKIPNKLLSNYEL